MYGNNLYLVWNDDCQRVGCWDKKKKDWKVEGFHCGDSFLVANGKWFNTDHPEKWTPCHLERMAGEWDEGAGFVLVNEDEEIIEPRWVGFRYVKLK